MMMIIKLKLWISNYGHHGKNKLIFEEKEMGRGI
jgi:hypothetical protein